MTTFETSPTTMGHLRAEVGLSAHQAIATSVYRTVKLPDRYHRYAARFLERVLRWRDPLQAAQMLDRALDRIPTCRSMRLARESLTRAHMQGCWVELPAHSAEEHETMVRLEQEALGWPSDQEGAQ